MNEVFKKTKTEKIELTDGFFLLPDGFKGIVLQRETEKTRKKIDKETKKPTGEEEKYTNLEQWYFPNLSKTLSRYLELKSTEAKSIEDLRDIVLRVEEKINSIRESWE